MPEPPQQPRIQIAKPQAGVLPVSAAQTAGNAANRNAQKGTPQRLKTVVRRLPPGLTQSEFEGALGEEWKVGQGKVSWAQFRPGKVSKDFSKPSRPARCYLQVTNQSHLEPLADKVKQTSFADARKSDKDAALIGPPILEFAPHNRTPLGRKRNDPRQGLIDQDPEFQEFLQSLTNPITKPAIPVTAKETGPKSTPLIEHLRAKKAAKEAAKENKEKASPLKGAKNARQAAKAESVEASKVPQPPSAIAPSAGQKGARSGKVEKGVKPVPKQMHKPAPAMDVKAQQHVQPSAPKTSPQVSQTAQSSQTVPVPPRRPEGSTGPSAAARMIQRDLGIRGGRGGIRGRGGRLGAVNGAVAPVNGTSHATVASQQSVSRASVQSPPLPASPAGQAVQPVANGVTPSTATDSSTPVAPPTGPKIFNKPAPGKIPPYRPIKHLSNVNPLSTQAFLKHANPSQGITEELLEAAFSPFGSISKVEIDKRKGFAYIDFADNESLVKAIQASPVKVANGNVQVLERKDRGPPHLATAPTNPGRGGPAFATQRGAPMNMGAGFRGARTMRGGGRGSVHGAANGFVVAAPTAGSNTTNSINGTTASNAESTVSTLASNETQTPATYTMPPTPDAITTATQDTGG